MPWHCPSCGNVIKHDAGSGLPQRGVRYRCHRCRIGLSYHRESNKLKLVEIDERKHIRRRRPRRAK